MLRIFTFISTIFFSAAVSAQSVNMLNIDEMKADSIDKKVLGNAEYMIVYDYVYNSTPELKKRVEYCETFLQIGEEYNRFGDYHQFRYDSLMDVTFKKGNQLKEKEVYKRLNLKMRIRFNESILMEKSKNKYMIQRTAGKKTEYQYEEDCPELRWALIDGDTIISGHQCKKASTSLFGRDYIAWYCPDISLPYGPYKFNGLPGLILRVTDTQNHHDFVMTEIRKVKGYNPIYYWTRKDIVKTTRNNVRELYEEFCKNPTDEEGNSIATIFYKDGKPVVKPRPYNPIELE